jgi:hypothetical protein
MDAHALVAAQQVAHAQNNHDRTAIAHSTGNLDRSLPAAVIKRTAHPAHCSRTAGYSFIFARLGIASISGVLYGSLSADFADQCAWGALRKLRKKMRSRRSRPQPAWAVIRVVTLSSSVKSV